MTTGEKLVLRAAKADPDPRRGLPTAEFETLDLAEATWARPDVTLCRRERRRRGGSRSSRLRFLEKFVGEAWRRSAARGPGPRGAGRVWAPAGDARRNLPGCLSREACVSYRAPYAVRALARVPGAALRGPTGSRQRSSAGRAPDL